MKKQTLVLICIGIVLLLPVLLPLFHPYISGTADGFAHKFRLVSFHTSINQGNIRPRWIGDLALGFGGPLFLFNYSLPYYIADIFYRIGFSIHSSGQLLLGFTLIASGITMFFLAKKLWGPWAGIIAAITYSYAPYHLLTVYSYEAWGEALAYVFPPLILCLFIIKKYKLVVIAWALFILTHNISSYIASPFIILFCFAYKKDISFIVKMFITSVFLTAFHWLPSIALTDTIKINELFQKEMGMRFAFFKPIVQQILTNITVLKTSHVAYYEFTVGLPILLALLASIPKLKKQLLIIACFITVIMALIFTDPVSDYVYNLRPLQFVLYPYRWLFVATFAGSLMSGFLFKKTTIPSFLFLAIVIICGLPFTKPSLDQFSFEKNFFEKPQLIAFALPTLKSMGSTEFLPKNMDMNFLFEKEQDYLNITHTFPAKFEGDAKITNTKIKQETLAATIDASKNTTITINTAFYPNWKATVDKEPTAITQDTFGRMQISVPKGNHLIQLRFGYSLIEKIGYAISILGLIWLIK